MKGGTLSVDDSVLDKPYAHYIALVGHYWSGKHHAVVKGINLITLYYTDPHGQHQPVNFRVYDKADNKTKNDYFLDMLFEVLAWGLEPAFVTGDSWYSCVKNLKTIKNHQLGFLFALENNRLVSIEEGTWVQVQKLDIPNDGLQVWLRDFGQVKLFRTHLKDQVRHYAIHLPDENDPTDNGARLTSFGKPEFEKLHDQHWQIVNHSPYLLSVFLQRHSAALAPWINRVRKYLSPRLLVPRQSSSGNKQVFTDLAGGILFE